MYEVSNNNTDFKEKKNSSIISNGSVINETKSNRMPNGIWMPSPMKHEAMGTPFKSILSDNRGQDFNDDIRGD